MRRLLFAVLLLAATGCQDAYLSPAPGSTPTPTPEPPQFPEFDGATLVVNSPASAEILLVSEDIEFDAEILDADGAPLDFEEIVWESSLDGEVFVGDRGDVELDWGIHELTVTANLPNGDRLQTILGGIRVQGEHTGIYAGSMNIAVEIEFQGTPVNALCAGGLDFTVDMSGEIMAGGGGCTVNLVVIDGFDLSYDVDAGVDDSSVEGDVGIDIGFFALPIGFDGAFTDPGRFEAVFEGQVLTFGLNGEIDANRVSPYVDP